MRLAERIRRGRRAIQLARLKGFDTSEWEDHLTSLMEAAGREPDLDEPLEPWVLWEWRRVSIPEWRHILGESVKAGDVRREGYARWMLREVLLDPEYQEDEL